jgi:hypothetical protein
MEQTMDDTSDLLHRINSLERSSRIAIPFGILGMIAILGSIYVASNELKQTRLELISAEERLNKVRAETQDTISQAQSKLESLNRTLEATLSSQEPKPTRNDIQSAIQQVATIDTTLSVARARVTPKRNDLRYGSMSVDIFYCAGTNPANSAQAKQLLTLRDGKSTGRWRVRELSSVLNATEGYRLSSDVIRFNADEREIAERLKQDIEESSGGNIGLQEITYPTPGYISIFMCGPK